MRIQWDIYIYTNISRRIENRAYSDAHFILIGFSMVQKCHWHCSETTIFSIIIFVQQDKAVLKLVTNFDTCLCFASAKRVFFARATCAVKSLPRLCPRPTPSLSDAGANATANCVRVSSIDVSSSKTKTQGCCLCTSSSSRTIMSRHWK